MTAESIAVSVGRSGKIRQKRAVFRDKLKRKMPLKKKTSPAIQVRAS